MSKIRKPEWTPQGAGKEFASRVLEAREASASSKPCSRTASGVPEGDVTQLAEGVRRGDRTHLARAITLIESNSPRHFDAAQQLIQLLLPDSGQSIRIGVTGVPGAGKSTFISAFGLWLIGQGHRVAVLAVDPSSSLSKGSILGDKTRMDLLARDPGSFIRPSPSGGALGGVARKTRESVVLCEAAGYDVILIETVGVGQSEITVRSMVDFFLLMQIAGAGDELQGIKKGIMELADLVAVNKADGENVPAADLACRELNNALHFLRHATPGWTTRAITCSALQGTGLKDIWDSIGRFVKRGQASGVFAQRRSDQVSQWFEALLTEAVLSRFHRDPQVQQSLPELREQVRRGELPAVLAVRKLLP